MWANIGGPGVGHAAGGHLLSIVTQLLKSKKVNLGKAAEIYAKMGIVFKDALIIIWRGKYQYNLLRPVTYINLHMDPTGKTHFPTPPYSEYSSGLSGMYSPAMQVLIREFGDILITDNTYTWRGVPPRQYASISTLNTEVLSFRVYAGIHYQFTMDITREMGRKIGNYIAYINLTPKNKDNLYN